LDMGSQNLIPEQNNELRETIIAGIRKRGDCHLKGLLISTASNDPITQGFSFRAHLEIIKEFLLNIVSLESLCMTVEPIPTSTLQTICTRNAATLQDLFINSEHSEVNCNVFTPLNRCQRISISSLSDGAIEISKLPSTLTKIDICGCIQQADMEHILFNLPNLQEIKLDGMGYDTSGRDGSSITLDMLRRFNQTRRVNRLRVAMDCLADEESMPLEGIPNDDPNISEMLVVRWPGHCYYHYGLDWKLNDAGFYTNSHSFYENF